MFIINDVKALLTIYSITINLIKFQIEQNHTVQIVHIDTTTMDHYCDVLIRPDRLNPQGLVKRGIKLRLCEFNRGDVLIILVYL